MSDARRRELERAAAAQGDAAAAGRALVERVRAGELDELRLRLAAHLGHAGARLAVGDAPDAPADLRGWTLGLRAFGQSAWVSASAAAIELCLPILQARLEGAQRQALERLTPYLRATLRTIRAWLAADGATRRATRLVLPLDARRALRDDGQPLARALLQTVRACHPDWSPRGVLVVGEVAPRRADAVAAALREVGAQPEVHERGQVADVYLVESGPRRIPTVREVRGAHVPPLGLEEALAITWESAWDLHPVRLLATLRDEGAARAEVSAALLRWALG